MNVKLGKVECNENILFWGNIFFCLFDLGVYM